MQLRQRVIIFKPLSTRDITSIASSRWERQIMAFSEGHNPSNCGRFDMRSAPNSIRDALNAMRCTVSHSKGNQGWDAHCNTWYTTMLPTSSSH